MSTPSNTAPDNAVFDNGNIILEGEIDPVIREILAAYNKEKFLQENPELRLSRWTGYPVLFYLLLWLFGKEWIQGKNFLEIGWGSMFGPRNLQFLKRIIKPEVGINAIVSTDKRDSDEGMMSYEWKNIAEWGIQFHCIFHHRIGPTYDKLEQVTDACLKPGWYYIAFRRIGSESSDPVNRGYFTDRLDYDDYSFTYRWKDKWWSRHQPEDIWYHVTILQKPSGIPDVLSETAFCIYSVIGE